MTTLPKVSVLIPTHNRAQYVCGAIDSVLAQTYQNVEIIVVDDGSTDGTGKIIEHNRDRIVYVYQDNQGVSAALNLGIEESSGEYLAGLGDDDIWLPDKLEVQMAFLEANPEFGMVHADMLILDVGSDDPKPKKRMLSRPIPSGHILPELIVKNVIMGSTVLIRRSCLDEVGLFDQGLRSSEDYHMWLRIARQFPIAYLDRPLAICRLHTSSLTHDRVNQHKWHLKALKKMLRLNPAVIDEVGRDIVHFAVAFKTAYMCFDQGSHKEARRYFAKALRLRSFHWHSHGYYLACWLPHPWINGLRHLKRSFANRRNGPSIWNDTKALQGFQINEALRYVTNLQV